MTNSSSSSFIVIVTDEASTHARSFVNAFLDEEGGSDTDVGEVVELTAAKVRDRYDVAVDDGHFTAFYKDVDNCDTALFHCARSMDTYLDGVHVISED